MAKPSARDTDEGPPLRVSTRCEKRQHRADTLNARLAEQPTGFALLSFAASASCANLLSGSRRQVAAGPWHKAPMRLVVIGLPALIVASSRDLPAAGLSRLMRAGSALCHRTAPRPAVSPRSREPSPQLNGY